MTETKQKTKKISRRDAIKLLGAAAGATVLANLPSKWNTPELASGVLPAHAQTSQLFSLVCQLDQLNTNDGTPPPSTVVITLAQAGISMTWTVPNPSSGVLTFGALSGTVLTNAAGLATIDLNTVLDTPSVLEGGAK